MVRTGAGNGACVNLRANRNAPDIAPPVPNRQVKFGDQTYPIFIDKINLATVEDGDLEGGEDSPRLQENGELTTIPEESGESQALTLEGLTPRVP